MTRITCRFSPPSIIKIHIFGSLKLKEIRCRLKNTQPLYILFVCLYFGEESALLNVAQADQDSRPSQQGFHLKWRQKLRCGNV